MSVEEIYNPLDKRHLADSIARAFFARQLHKLPPNEPFHGAGIYAIYYRGKHPLYKAIAESHAEFVSLSQTGVRVPDDKQPIPVYIGKSDPPGSRKGTGVEDPQLNQKKAEKTSQSVDLEEAEQFLTDRPSHRKLYNRLVKHSKSIAAATNLKLDDFACRFMLVDEIWVPLGEARLVERFRPLWNTLIEGFGSNPEGGGRKNTARPVWDILHPGRKENLNIRVDVSVADRIVSELRGAKTSEALRRAIDEHRKARKAFNKAQKIDGDNPESPDLED